MLEQIQMPDRYKIWLDEVASMFGGLDICALEMIVARDGREYIIEVNDCALSLMGDTQEEDRRHIAELVTQRMQVLFLLMCNISIERFYFSRLDFYLL